MSENVLVVTDSSFDVEVLQSNVPVLVDFWAPWCGPCTRLSPVIEEIAEEFIGKVKVVKVNVDDNHESPSKYDVRGIPALVLFKNGLVVANHVGLSSKVQLIDFINKSL